MTETLPARASDWKPEFPTAQTPNYVSQQAKLAKMARLAQQLRKGENMTREQIFDETILEKMRNINILEGKGICSKDQVTSEHMNEAFSKLVPSAQGSQTKGPLTDVEDIETGFELFQAIVYCPSQLQLLTKIYNFVDEVLSTESTRTIIQTLDNHFRSENIPDPTTLNLVKDFYFVLASTLDLQYGNILLATSTKSQLQEVIDKDWPFFTNNTDLVKTCIRYSDCDSIQNILQKLGISH